MAVGEGRADADDLVLGGEKGAHAFAIELPAGVLPQVFGAEQSVGTLFLSTGDRLTRRKHWIAHTLKPSGSLSVDQGAYEAIMRGGRSLLPKGITAVSGSFSAGDCVSCVSPSGAEFARGLVNYSAADLQRIKGLHTSAIESTLQFKVSDEIIHRDNMSLLPER